MPVLFPTSTSYGCICDPSTSIPGVDDHYKPFSEVYGTTTSEEHRPSLSAKHPKKTVPIPTSVQHAKNTNIMVMCEECDMWRFVKLSYLWNRETTFSHNWNITPSAVEQISQIWKSTVTFPLFMFVIFIAMISLNIYIIQLDTHQFVYTVLLMFPPAALIAVQMFIHSAKPALTWAAL